MAHNPYARPAFGHRPGKDEEVISVPQPDGTLVVMVVDATLAKEVTRLRREGKKEEADTLLSWFV